MKKLILVPAAATVFAAGASWLLNRLPSVYTNHWGWSVLLLALLFAALGFYYRSRTTAVELVPALIAGFVIRFLAGLVFLLVMFLVAPSQFLPLAAHFMAHWLLFTLAEIAYLPNPRSRTPQTP